MFPCLFLIFFGLKHEIEIFDFMFFRKTFFYFMIQTVDKHKRSQVFFKVYKNRKVHHNHVLLKLLLAGFMFSDLSCFSVVELMYIKSSCFKSGMRLHVMSKN